MMHETEHVKNRPGVAGKARGSPERPRQQAGQAYVRKSACWLFTETFLLAVHFSFARSFLFAQRCVYSTLLTGLLVVVEYQTSVISLRAALAAPDVEEFRRWAVWTSHKL